MKGLTLTASVIFVLVLMSVGCRSRFEGIDKLSTADSATLVVTSRATGDIDLKPVRIMLAGAEWIDSQPINKGGYWLRVDGFPEIFVSEVNGCFWMADYRGLFKIADEERSDFYEYLDGQARMISAQSKPTEPE